MEDESLKPYQNLEEIIAQVGDVYQELISARKKNQVKLVNDLMIKREKLLQDADSIMEEFDLDYEWPRFSIKKKKDRNVKIIDALVEGAIIKITSSAVEVIYDGGALVAKIFDEPYDLEIWSLNTKDLIHLSHIEDKHTIDIIEIMESYAK